MNYCLGCCCQEVSRKPGKHPFSCVVNGAFQLWPFVLAGKAPRYQPGLALPTELCIQRRHERCYCASTRANKTEQEQFILLSHLKPRRFPSRKKKQHLLYFDSVEVSVKLFTQEHICYSNLADTMLFWWPCKNISWHLRRPVMVRYLKTWHMVQQVAALVKLGAKWVEVGWFCFVCFCF